MAQASRLAGAGSGPLAGAPAEHPKIGLRVWRIIATSAILFSFFFALYDASITANHPLVIQPLSPLHYSLHHRIEAIVRCLMLAIALLTAWRGRGKSARLLTWALIGSSLDIYWQWYGISGPLLWTAMLLKYAGTSFGLMQFLRFAASFGGGDYRGIRHYFYRAAPWALLLALFGFSAQFLKLPESAYPFGSFRWDAAVRPLFDAYLLGDAAMKLAMVVASAVGLATANLRERPQLLLCAGAFWIYALGTAVHFGVRTYLGHDTEALNYIDADAAATLPIGTAAVLLGKRRFFDVEYVLDRALAGTVVGGVLLVLYYLLDHQYGDWAARIAAERFSAVFNGGAVSVESARVVLEIIVGLLFFLLFHRLYEWCHPAIARVFFPEREKRIDALREFRTKLPAIHTVAELRELIGSLHDKAAIEFARVFTKDGETGFQAVMPGGPENVAPIPAHDEAVVEMRSSLREARLDDVTATKIPGVLALPMLVGGKLYGFLACGPSVAERGYARDEIDELAIIARETGVTLFALQAHRDI